MCCVGRPVLGELHDALGLPQGLQRRPCAAVPTQTEGGAWRACEYHGTVVLSRGHADTPGRLRIRGIPVPHQATDRYARRKDALTDFDNAKFSLIDGKTTVPTADWEGLMPPDANGQRRLDVRSNDGAKASAERRRDAITRSLG
jgi:hypothetical protein